MKGDKMDSSDTDSMTTVNVKDFETNPLDYQEAPPAYRYAKNSTTVQVTKVVALAAVIIAGMLSVSIVFSAWISATSCQTQQQQQQSIPVLEGLLQPEHLKSLLGELDMAESKLENKGNAKANKDKEQVDASSEEEENSNEASNDGGGVTMIRLPLELNLQEHMFDKKHRSHMNCVIEKKKAEEIVDEQSKPLPTILGLNMTTDPRYLHFSGEKMAISCESGNFHRQMPLVPPPPPARQHTRQQQQQIPFHLSEMINSAIAAAGSASVPVHIIGPIPFTQQEQRRGQEYQRQVPQLQVPFHLVNQFEGPFQHPFSQQQQQDEEEAQESSNFNPLSALGIPPHLINVIQQHENNEESQQLLPPSGPIFMLPQTTEIRERALPHPIPIMPRAHFQHLIRPRRSVDPEPQEKVSKRVKRCSCDCACKNHKD